MGVIHCCSGLRRSKTFVLQPLQGFLVSKLDFVSSCAVCGHAVVQITRLDFNSEVSTVRKTNAKALALFEKLKSSILFEEKVKYNPALQQGSNFYLNYNEFGRKKRCYSNLSSLKMGLFDSKPVCNEVSRPLDLSRS